MIGRNSFAFDIANSANVTLGAPSQQAFYAGQLGFTQSTTNVDFTRDFNVGLRKPLQIATGAEFRYESSRAFDRATPAPTHAATWVPTSKPPTM